MTEHWEAKYKALRAAMLEMSRGHRRREKNIDKIFQRILNWAQRGEDFKIIEEVKRARGEG